MGGDEFLITLFDTDPATTERVAHRLEKAGEERGPVSFSLGWAAREKGEKLEETVNRADRELIQVRVVRRPGTYTRRTPQNTERGNEVLAPAKAGEEMCKETGGVRLTGSQTTRDIHARPVLDPRFRSTADPLSPRDRYPEAMYSPAVYDPKAVQTLRTARSDGCQTVESFAPISRIACFVMK